MADAGAVFAIIWLALFVPISLAATVLFHLRSGKQPIKARLPPLVVVTDAVLIIFVITLCVQRIVETDYPCLLNLWAAYIGTIILLNTYVVRCWILFFNYYHTQQMITQETEADSLKHRRTYSDDDLERKISRLDENFFFRFKKYTGLPFLTKLVACITIVLLIPCAALTATDSTVRDATGDEACDKSWGDALLAAYVAIYVIVFSMFAYGLQSVVDAFRIKEELRFTGLVGALAVLPWFLFNNIFEDVNNDVFPFSTLSLILAATAAFSASTVWPLYRSIHKPPQVEFQIPANMSSFRDILDSDEGFRVFKNFLTKEFSVENLLFWDEVRGYRIQKAQGLSGVTLVNLARGIYAKFLIRGAPFEVNLPGSVVTNLEKALSAMKHGVADELRMLSANSDNSQVTSGSIILKSLSSKDEVAAAQDRNSVPTIFDDASDNIFNLMESDSFQRFQRSEEYLELVDKYKKELKKQQYLTQMEII